MLPTPLRYLRYVLTEYFCQHRRTRELMATSVYNALLTRVFLSISTHIYPHKILNNRTRLSSRLNKDMRNRFFQIGNLLRGPTENSCSPYRYNQHRIGAYKISSQGFYGHDQIFLVQTLPNSYSVLKNSEIKNSNFLKIFFFHWQLRISSIIMSLSVPHKNWTLTVREHSLYSYSYVLWRHHSMSHLVVFY